MSSTIQPHEDIQTLGNGIHCVRTASGKTPLGRRMTMIGLPGGKLAIHSAVALSEAGMAALDRLGRVAYILVPNTGHDSDAPFFADRYPEAVVLAPSKHAAKLQRKTRVNGSLEDGLPGNFAGVLDSLAVEGTRMHEFLFLHRPSRTLILTDLAFNFVETDFKGLTRMLMRFNRATTGFGPSRLATGYFFHDNAALGASLQSMMQRWEFDRIVLSHGRVVERDARTTFARAFAPWLTGAK